ncbi:MAG: DUF1295 domain-containing protein [Alphaproteobacteria bacterium]|nr:DUF1295 domain-containing protein [Alphaproteobacteria bacterium]
MAERSSPTRLVVTLVAAGLIAAVGWGVGGAHLGPAPLLAVCGGVALGLQWLAFVPAYLQQSERFYDLTGSLTYLTIIGLSLGLSAADGAVGPRPLLVSALVVIWALRLGSFLFRRIHRDGKDGRFDDIKPDPVRFLNAWSLQGLWVFLTALGALILNTRGAPGPALGPLDALGLGVWALGFGLEVVADRQKSRFKADPAHQGRFIDLGLWAWSRHPNYFGEITLWVGVFLIGASSFQGAEWAALLSPLFVTLLLTRVSGVPMLEARADARWGGQADYEAYKARTPVLIPRPPRAQ